MRTTAIRFISALPGVERAARIAARRLAGRHYVATMAVVTTSTLAAHPNGAVLLARHTFRGGRWRVLGGWVRRREDPALACAREVFEETGLTVQIVDIIGSDVHAVGGVALRYGGLTIAYHCVIDEPPDEPLHPRSIELAEVRWFERHAAEELASGFEQAMIAKAFSRKPRHAPSRTVTSA